MDFEMDNITVRKPLRSNSMDNIFNFNSRNNSSLLDTTMMSLPNNSLNDSDEIGSYKETIERLNTELESAHMEIDNLNSENFRLKMDIGQYQKLIETYKKVSILETKCLTPKPTRKANIIRSSCFSTPPKLILPHTTAQQLNTALVAQTLSDVGNTPLNTICRLERTQPTQPQAPIKSTENDVLIFDEQKFHQKNTDDNTAMQLQSFPNTSEEIEPLPIEPGRLHADNNTLALEHTMGSTTQQKPILEETCLSKVQSQFLVLDDILDGGTMRRGKPCWHLQPNVGLFGINDALLIRQSMMEVLDLYFGKTPIYTDLLRQFNETLSKITVGEHLDLWSNYNKEKNNIDIFNTDRIYSAIADIKCPYYTFKLPIFLPLLLVKDGKKKATNELNNICMDLGRLMQCQDDYMDAYGDEIDTGKTGRDIQEGKCSWVAVTALQHCNDAQRAIFEEYYGSQDPEHVKRIKQLYDELHLPQLYEQCERTMYEDIMRRIVEIPHEGAKIFLLNVLNASYKRVS